MKFQTINNRNSKIKKIFFSICIIILFGEQTIAQKIGQYGPFEKWYQNPLGFYPLTLEASNSFILPAIATTAILLITKKDTTLVNKLSFYNESGVSKGYVSNTMSVYQTNCGFVFRMRKYLGLGTEINSYHVKDKNNDTWGFGIRPFARWYFINKKTIRLYFESGAGVIWFINEFPQPTGFFGDNRTGTHFNFSPKYGIGSEINIDKKISIQIGIRHVHISNANVFGSERNPSNDSNGFTIGFIYRVGKTTN